MDNTNGGNLWRVGYAAWLVFVGIPFLTVSLLVGLLLAPLSMIPRKDRYRNDVPV